MTDGIPADAHDRLLARLGELEDQQALRTLMLRAWRALDLKDWDAWISCWSEDAVFEFEPWGTLRGREAVLERVREAETGYPAMQHHILNMYFEVTGDRARGYGYMWFLAVQHAERPDDHFAMGGPYLWGYRRGADGWRLTEQRLGVSWTRGQDESMVPQR
ncbi:GdmX [Streptomyces longwoodensis]|uniref:GdmX n=1 Tax=Streptomyces longwoodensis TaxID=68231 RepID=A0A117QKI9_9ACTN|nr:nuclear transport factor 2 family protein [Streptomyces longwoodensis]KUN33431.1 GdmX [Streptomyces longwoodensis]